ncbi:peroxisomal biogenesis factor 19 [Colletes gigas]|uniref:peroxisomal biogenesis factor 19 n=1 Tax=Colletes gigas TaxID=935657 RepID=UPI001C9A5EEB|nr:peroxisomal biogenesis factor 19 [Colletes gigas]
MADEKLSNQVEDQELNDLLDSALKDFIKEQQVNKDDASKIDTLESTTENNSVETVEDDWTTNFMKDTAEQFEEHLQNLIKNGNESEFGEFVENSCRRVAQTIASAMTDEKNADKDSVSTDFQSAITRALNDLSATSENLQSEADLSEMLGQASLEDNPGAIFSIMQGMLQHLLSKEILYPSLKALTDKYREWFEEKKTTISSGDLKRFKKQLELMQQICSELEKEKDEDTEETKKNRFEMVVSLVQELLGYGRLPKELEGEHAMPFQTDAEGDPIIPALLRGMESPQNCRLM